MKEFLSSHHRELYCIGKTYELFDCLKRLSTNECMTTVNHKLAYIKKIIGYIHVKYSEPFHMDELAHVCGLERSYMTRLFKNATTGISCFLPYEAGASHAREGRVFDSEYCLCCRL